MTIYQLMSQLHLHVQLTTHTGNVFNHKYYSLPRLGERLLALAQRQSF
jgi:hypothetical protein